ncbi:MAG TPA: MotA/TolQ/ExbB proton channel family protein [Oligoflexus sp.]|uniref:motility protein A n=1 Tax=Oligoflexus sp. TaxID=1971216 RepID=UPI002D71C6AE|nr:MotA/TolQ/ExbB proton channel family protein [Oligoflexus sp.]HYX35868.1 MotA/TolQ/ExbB proton channel family protein [Oligoflexus sp.]
MAYIFGLVVGLLALRVSLYFLDQSVSMYFDDVALTMVLGGTIAVAVIGAPWHHVRELRRGLVGIVFGRNAKHASIIEAGLRFIQSRDIPRGTMASSTVAGEILRDGQELLSLNFTTQEVENILQERLHQAIEKQRQVADFFLSLSKYPPAFGLVGTVLGLVNLMRAITEGMDPRQTGVKMALALVATLYGLIVANFVVAPIGEAMTKRVALEHFHAEIALQAVLLAADHVSLLKSQEMLNSYVSKQQRVNIIGKLVKDAA